MDNVKLSMPVAVEPSGTDPITFYATFAGKMTASWSPKTGLVVWTAAEPDIARLHAPIKAWLEFIPKGTMVGAMQAPTDTLLLHTWPTAYVAAVDALRIQVPSEIRIENVDASAVRNAVHLLYTAINRTEQDVDAFMKNNGQLLVDAGTAIGAAAPAASPPSAATPNNIKITMFRGLVYELNPVQFLSSAADHIGVYKTMHPLLSQLDLEGWIEVIAFDASGRPLVREPYELYLADSSIRKGTTDTDGRIYEIQIPPPGIWGLELKNYPSFRFWNPLKDYED